MSSNQKKINRFKAKSIKYIRRVLNLKSIEVTFPVFKTLTLSVSVTKSKVSRQSSCRFIL